MMEAWNNHFLVMVGRKLTEVFERERLPPVIAKLEQKREVLTQQLESIPSIPSAREGTAEVAIGLLVVTH